MTSQTTPTQLERPLRVFLCHSSRDKPVVRDLYHRLRKDGFAPWLDEWDLILGQNWRDEIPKAVRASDVVIVCLSKDFYEAGYRQKEVRLALDVADEQPEGAIFLIPLKLEECQVPAGLTHLHWANLSEDGAYLRLVTALKVRATALACASSIVVESTRETAAEDAHRETVERQRAVEQARLEQEEAA